MPCSLTSWMVSSTLVTNLGAMPQDGGKGGHRLRLEIVNGDSPATEILWAHYYRPDKIGSDTIHHDAVHPSEMILPVLPSSI